MDSTDIKEDGLKLPVFNELVFETLQAFEQDTNPEVYKIAKELVDLKTNSKETRELWAKLNKELFGSAEAISTDELLNAWDTRDFGAEKSTRTQLDRAKIKIKMILERLNSDMTELYRLKDEIAAITKGE